MFAGPQICPGCQSQRTLSLGTSQGALETLCQGRRAGDRESRGPPARSRLPFRLPSPALGAGSFLSLTTLLSLLTSLPSPLASISSPLCPLPVSPSVCPSLLRSLLPLSPSCLPASVHPSFHPSLPLALHPSTHPPIRRWTCSSVHSPIHPFSPVSIRPPLPLPIPPSSIHLLTRVTNPPSPPPSPSNIDWMSSVLQALF